MSPPVLTREQENEAIRLMKVAERWRYVVRSATVMLGVSAGMMLAWATSDLFIPWGLAFVLTGAYGLGVGWHASRRGEALMVESGTILFGPGLTYAEMQVAARTLMGRAR